jgi:hypothetical protein
MRLISAHPDDALNACCIWNLPPSRWFRPAGRHVIFGVDKSRKSDLPWTDNLFSLPDRISFGFSANALELGLGRLAALGQQCAG